MNGFNENDTYDDVYDGMLMIARLKNGEGYMRQ